MTESTADIRELLDRALARIDILLGIYNSKLVPEVIELDDLEGPLLRLEPREVYDACICGVDTNAQKLVYDERMVIVATMHHNNWDEDEALEFLNYNTFVLADQEDGPIFMTAGRVVTAAPSEAGPEN
jgi:hypothetical protein